MRHRKLHPVTAEHRREIDIRWNGLNYLRPSIENIRREGLSLRFARAAMHYASAKL
jgi:hypothetical protein